LYVCYFLYIYCYLFEFVCWYVSIGIVVGFTEEEEEEEERQVNGVSLVIVYMFPCLSFNFYSILFLVVNPVFVDVYVYVFERN
jgi:hypothetical protein